MSELAVGVVAGTAIQGVAAHLMFRRVLERHPNAFLVTLEHWGVTIRIRDSQSFVSEHLADGLTRLGRDPEEPIALVGHSQGGLAVLRYALDQPERVPVVISVGVPWLGASLAGTVNTWTRRILRRSVPALADMQPGSAFLTRLHRDFEAAPEVAQRTTNIYSVHEMLINPYYFAHVDVPGVRNVLIATADEYDRHVVEMGISHPIDEHVEARVNHLEEMNEPKVRSVIWRTIDEAQQPST